MQSQILETYIQAVNTEQGLIHILQHQLKKKEKFPANFVLKLF